jgi:capsid protein
LQRLRDRSRDLVHNDPLASGAISTVVENVIGTGLWFEARPGVDALKVIDDEQETWTETRVVTVSHYAARNENFVLVGGVN